MTTTPTTWLAPQQVNPSSTGAQFEQKIVGLSNGNFLVVYSDDSGAIGTGDGRDIVGVIYDAEGTIVTTAFQVNTFGNADTEMDASIVADSNGGFYMAYEDQNGSGTQLLIQRYNAAGASIDQAFAASDPGTQFIGNPSLAIAPSTGNLMISYQYSDGLDDPVRAIIMDSGLNALAGTAATGFTVRGDAEPAASNGVFENDTAGLSNGNFVTVYREFDSDYGIEFVVTNGTTGATVSIVNIGSTGTNGVLDFAPKVAALTGGGFVVVWVEDDAAADNIVFARYSSVGTLQGTVTTSVDTGNNYTQPAVIGLEDGGFYIAAYDNTSDSIEGTRYNSAGVQVGSSMALVVGSQTSFPEVALSLSSDGRILMTYDDPAGDIQTLILDPRETTINADAGDGQITARLTDDTTINGSNVSDTLLGQDGDDSLFGNSGVDTLYGGAGNDYLDGGLFEDDSYGGAGDDTFHISSGNAADNVFGGSGTDTLDFSDSGNSGDVIFTNGSGGTYLGGSYDFSSIEVILGNDVDRTWTMAFGTQSVVAGSGDDLFIHGDGMFIDNINAGGGVDTFDASLEDASGIIANLGAGTLTGLGGTTTFTNFENVIGTQVDDAITGSNANNSLSGGLGNDTIYGASGVDELYGGAGDDFLDGGLFLDNAYGGAGNDTFHISVNNAADNVFGGSGTDTLDFSDSNLSGDVTYTGSTAGTYLGSGYDFTSIDVILANNVDRTWTMAFGTQSVVAGSGDDLFIHGNGMFIDNIDAGGGVDTFDASLETSTGIVADMAAGTLAGLGGTTTFAGFENVSGTQVDDIITGTNGNNTIAGNAGNDSMYGGSGDDTFIVTNLAGSNLVAGGSGTDVIDLSGSTSLFSGSGAAIASGGTSVSMSSIETMIGTDYGDVITSEGSFNSWFMGLGNDELTTGLSGGIDNVDMGGGNDTVTNILSSDYIIDLAAGTYAVGAATGDLIGVENYNGGDGIDTVIGTGSRNIIDGGGGNDIISAANGNDNVSGGNGRDDIDGGNGNDVIRGGNGNDVLVGGSGNDRLFGGNGKDTVEYAGGVDTTVDLNTAGVQNTGHGLDTLNGIENITTGSGADVLIGINGKNILTSGGGNDVLEGRNGNDILDAGNGNDLLLGGNNNDLMYGGGGNDSLVGGNGNDVMTGGNGHDVMTGGNGNDRFIGGNGNDVMTGGAANDDFIFVDGFGDDVITDFDAFNNAEEIDLSGVTQIVSFADLSANHMVQSGADVIITAGSNTITLENVSIGALGNGDFIF